MALMLGVAAGGLWLPPRARAQSIGDWNGTYRAPAASPPPRIDAAPVIIPTEAAEHAPLRKESRAEKPASHAPRTRHDTPAPATAATATPTPASAPASAPKPAAAATPVQKLISAPMPMPSTHFRLLPPPSHLHKTPPPSPPAVPDLPQWPLGVTALLGGAAGWALWRRKSARQNEVAPADVQPLPESAPDTALAALAHSMPVHSAPRPDEADHPIFTPAQTVAPPVVAPAALPSPEVSVDFAPTRFATTLAEAVLRYRISVINRGTEPLGPLVIFGAMEAAGADQAPDEAPIPRAASRRDRPFRPAPGFSPHPHFTPLDDPSELGHADLHDHHDAPQPLYPARSEEPAPPPAAPEPVTLVECHRLMMLRPGEGADFAGQMRLPLAAIAPIQLGSAALFVPLIRLKIEAGQTTGELFIREVCLIVGEAQPDAPSASLGPLRLTPDTTTADHLATRTVPLPLPLSMPGQALGG